MAKILSDLTSSNISTNSEEPVDIAVLQALHVVRNQVTIACAYHAKPTVPTVAAYSMIIYAVHKQSLNGTHTRSHQAQHAWNKTAIGT